MKNVKTTPQKTSTKNWTRDQLFLALYKEMMKRNAVGIIANKFRNNHLLSEEFGMTAMKDILLETISKVVNVWEKYWQDPEATDLRMDKFGDITGYLVNAFHNNYAKKYSSFKTEKRASLKALVSTNPINSANPDEDINLHNLEAMTSYTPIDISGHKENRNVILQYLRVLDSELNYKFTKNGMKKSDIPMKHRSQLSRLYILLINPRYKGNLDEIQARLGFSDYVFKRERAKLLKIIKKYFKDEGKDMLKFCTENNTSGEQGDIYYLPTQAPSLEIHTNITMKVDKIKKMRIYTHTISINEYKNKRWIPVHTVKSRNLEDKGNVISFEEARAQLTKTQNMDMEKANNILMKLKNDNNLKLVA